MAVSCLAVIQGASLRAVWTRQLHRIAGTGVGLLLAGGILALPLDAWRVALLMMALAFVIETLIVRHYGLATVFITPLTILLADAPQLGLTPPDGLLQARLVDTVLGCLVGLAGGLALHSPGFRTVLGGPLRRLVRLGAAVGRSWKGPRLAPRRAHRPGIPHGANVAKSCHPIDTRSK